MGKEKGERTRGVVAEGLTGRCPHCGVTVRFEGLRERRYTSVRGIPTPEPEFLDMGAVVRLESRTTHLDLMCCSCPACGQIVLTVRQEERYHLGWPETAGRMVPPEVPKEIAADYLEAALVLKHSAKASAGLSRRCLESVLEKAGGATQKKLSDKIEHVLSSLPPAIAKNLGYLREIGNFAAHTQKDENTGMIVDVEPAEAEWTLDVLDSLFDHYYVQPERNRRRRAAFDKKIEQAGREPLV